MTPAHDPKDFEIGQRHNLPQIQVIGQDARMTAEAGRFQGLTREEARQAVLEALRAGGFLVKARSHSAMPQAAATGAARWWSRWSPASGSSA